MRESKQYNYEIPIVVFCQIPQGKLDALANLIKELSSAPYIFHLKEHLEGILIVPDNLIKPTVHEIAKTFLKKYSYLSDPTPPKAIAIPVEYESNLLCFIVMSESLLQSVDENNYHTLDFVMAVLEGLLYVQIYVIAWKDRGYLYPKTLASSFETDLFLLSSLIHDEYIVCKVLALILATDRLVETEERKIIGIIRSKEPIALILDASAIELAQIIARTLRDKIQQPWSMLMRCIWRHMFKPLARISGYDINLDLSKSTNKPNDSCFYRDYIAKYWDKIQEELESYYNRGLNGNESVLNKISKIIEEFLREVGITHSDIDKREYEVKFNKRFFDFIKTLIGQIH
ncbi:MAG: hypothetical protein AB1410_08170 [Acidobacteriota bacterium]